MNNLECVCNTKVMNMINNHCIGKKIYDSYKEHDEDFPYETLEEYENWYGKLRRRITKSLVKLSIKVLTEEYDKKNMSLNIDMVNTNNLCTCISEFIIDSEIGGTMEELYDEEEEIIDIFTDNLLEYNILI